MIGFFLLLFVVGLLFEITLTTAPVVLVVLLLTAVFQKSSVVFFLAFIAGIILDVVRLGHIGQTSLFLLLFLFLIFLYRRKFEVQSLPFVTGAAAVGSLVFLVFFKFSDVLLQTFVAVAVTMALFLMCEKLFPRVKKAEFV